MIRAIALRMLPVLIIASAAAAQLGSEPLRNQKQFVVFEGAGTTAVEIGKTGHVDLRFRVLRGDHVNSNQPGSELLIPTRLSLSSPSDVLVGNISYPPGQKLTLAIAPDEKLSVYSGSFNIGADVTPTRKAAPGNYRAHGQLRYQACSDRACYPPQNLPVEFDFKVVRPSKAARRNPAQSPHAH
ncbi:MAG TPA: protein-disulfide reductase DsbD domain-containing protein [Terriglobales bacterium]|nr:protein-disulfide reductase DsbD domain-containing protein [Terriglobales bacterium]